MSEQPPQSFPPGEPEFPHHNEAFTRQLGLPDSPVIHLAVQIVMERLLAELEEPRRGDDQVRIAAMRTASGTVLMRRPFVYARTYLKEILDGPADWASVRNEIVAPGPDWLGEARAAMLAAGEDPGPEARRMATRWGWDPGPTEVAEEKPLA
ncbi:hypothetical protein [Caldimonas taiwanensis]|uniref:hypothetical protein n=1 Tax=Caldimonas taiwanensis TaxID=307483 RepID=UPI000780E628|nr:hypothetical protein [Caldimonas taiwanensis]